MNEPECVPDPDKRGSHWFSRHGDVDYVAIEWTGSSWQAWGGLYSSIGIENRGYRYIRPVLTPEQEDVLHAEIDALTATVAEQAGTIETLTTWFVETKATFDDLRAPLTAATTARDNVVTERMVSDGAFALAKAKMGGAEFTPWSDEYEAARTVLEAALKTRAAGDAVDLERRVV